MTMTMVVHKFKGYIQGHAPTLVTDSQYMKRVMEMSGKRQDALPSNVLWWICDIKEETSFTKDSTVELVSSKENPEDLLTRFTLQNKWVMKTRLGQQQVLIYMESTREVIQTGNAWAQIIPVLCSLLQDAAQFLHSLLKNWVSLPRLLEKKTIFRQNTDRISTEAS
jgi:hypothetical protein